MKEIIKNYFATTDGRIWSDKSHSYLSQRVSNKGYYVVNLSVNGKCKTFSVHRLIAKAFIPNPKSYPVINHKDDNKLNNSIDNLEWCSYQYNRIHALKNGLANTAVGTNTKNGHFNKEEISLIRQLSQQGISQYKIAKQFGVTRAAIQYILNGLTYKWA